MAAVEHDLIIRAATIVDGTGGADGVRELAADPAGLDRLRAEGAAIAPSLVFSGRWEHVHVRLSPTHPGLRDRDVASIASTTGEAPTDVILRIAVDDGFETQFSTVMRNPDDRRLGALVAHPAAQLGGSDAGAHTQSNTDSCYAVWTLQHWVREREVLDLERAVAKLTGDQADLLGLHDRGRVAVGLAADLVLFDPERIGWATCGSCPTSPQAAFGWWPTRPKPDDPRTTCHFRC